MTTMKKKTVYYGEREVEVVAKYYIIGTVDVEVMFSQRGFEQEVADKLLPQGLPCELEFSRLDDGAITGLYVNGISKQFMPHVIEFMLKIAQEFIEYQ